MIFFKVSTFDQTARGPCRHNVCHALFLPVPCTKCSSAQSYQGLIITASLRDEQQGIFLVGLFLSNNRNGDKLEKTLCEYGGSSGGLHALCQWTHGGFRSMRPGSVRGRAFVAEDAINRLGSLLSSPLN